MALHDYQRAKVAVQVARIVGAWNTYEQTRPRNAAALRMWVEGKSYREIALINNVSIARIHQIVGKTYLRLVQYLEKNHGISIIFY